MKKYLPAVCSAAALALLYPAHSRAQSSCDSEAQPAPTALVERFISADCEGCWADAKTPPPAMGELVLDWIVPGKLGDDAPLSAAATRDALQRLEALHQPVPKESSSARQAFAGATHTVRVAHGLPFNGYLGTSIELKPAAGGPWTAWLVIVQTIAANTEGSPVERHLVRNALTVTWSPPEAADAAPRFFESRPMSLPEGVKPEQISVLGWVQDAKGRVLAAAQSRCIAQ